MANSAKPVTHPRAAFVHRDFRLYLSARFLALCSHQMLAVAVAQKVYEMTRDPLHLGTIGLALFFPKFGFTLLAGHTADRYDRRLVILACRLAQFIAVLGLILFTALGFKPLAILYALLFLLGTANAFDGPSSQAIVPQLVPAKNFSSAVAWNSSVMQTALIAGPALSGWIYALAGEAMPVFIVVAIMRLISALQIFRMNIRTGGHLKTEFSWQTVLAGLRYVYRTRIILGIISLDLFAVLLGGAVALMPIFANDILKVGPSGLGILRAAPSLGAALMAVALAYLPPLKRAGSTMLACVALFGMATIFFGLSRHLWLSLVCLFILGASDMISVVIRGVLVQIKTPPEMRGRVSAVNLVFIGASNELGEFESGITAAWFGTIPAVIIGGIGTLAVVGIWAWLFPELRKVKRLDENAA